ncbi:MAG TPA: hypothetical protein VEJ63_21395 [Planctomycetota bacterium]|nr:hypothetical protein [Planctomycetota bacterium]
MRAFLAGVLLLGVSVCAAEAPLLKPPEYWFHVMSNTNNDEHMNNKVYPLMERAAKAGYTTISYYDGRFSMKEFQTPEYIERVKKFRTRATEMKLKIAAGICAWGYGEEMIRDNPNLMEGMPARNVEFIVKNGKLIPHDPDVKLLNGNLEEWKAENQPAGWNVDDVGKVSFKDETAKHEGKASLRMQDVVNGEYKRTRLIQQIKVKPWHNYAVTCMMKTENCKNQDIRIMAIGNIPLNWTPLPIQETMDWTRIGMIFNSQEFTQVSLYLGTWNGKRGKMWYDDIQIAPAGFANIIRRDAYPLTITSLDGKTVYEEGKDFAKVVDPKLGSRVSPWHESPEISIPAGSRLKEGDKVLASFHHGMTCLTTNNTAVCMSEPLAYEQTRKEVTFIKTHVKPDIYFMQHDEIRFANFCDQCQKRKMTCGQLLADNIAKCVKIVEEIDPGKPIVVWSDMVDPHHNAKQKEDDGAPHTMFLCRGEGPWWEAWKGMPKQLGIVNWNNGHVKSVKFFDGEGHQQILSHCDTGALMKWLNETKDCSRIAGIMYTTWDDNWGPLEAYVKAAKEWFEKNPRK